MFSAFQTSPRLCILSPEKTSGKTRLLEVIETLCAAPRLVVYTSTAAIFRLIETEKPTLLIDEADAIFGPRAKEHEDLRAILNAGYRRGAVVMRCVGAGAKLKVRSFPSFCPVALAVIGDLPETIISRAVVVRMRRRAPNEVVHQWRERYVIPEATGLRERLAAWAAAQMTSVGQADPPMPDGLVDRSADNWEPPLAIADAQVERGRSVYGEPRSRSSPRRWSTMGAWVFGS